MPDNWAHFQVSEVTQGQENPVPGLTVFDPAVGATIDSATFAIGWQGVEGATAYHFQMDNNGNFSSPEYDLMLDGSAFVPAGPVPGGKYYWRVAVVSGAQTGAWSVPAEMNSLVYPAAAGAALQDTAAERVLGITWQLQRKDTRMVCHAGDNETRHCNRGMRRTKALRAPRRATIVNVHLSQCWHPTTAGSLSQDRIAFEDYQGNCQ